MNNLRQLREQNKLSLRKVQELTGINFNTIAQLERGQMELTPKYLEIFADFYQVSYDYLLNRKKNPFDDKEREKIIDNITKTIALIEDKENLISLKLLAEHILKKQEER